MPKSIPCKFYAKGSCLKGEQCNYAHDSSSFSSNICSFFQRGLCSFGSRCRYEHVSPLNMDSVAASSSSHTPKTTTLSASTATHPHEDQKTGREPDMTADCALDACPTCGVNSFEDDRDTHTEKCEKKQRQVEASVEIECSVCLDKVLSKPTPTERKFGVLSECDHPFCISCIKNWRNSSSSSGYEVTAAVRSCPICRKVSYFVIPSVVWFTTKEEKQEIVSNYKARLRSIDCKHFDFGNGNCPFGKSCFYKHTVNPGSYTWKYNRPPSRRQGLGPYDAADMIEFGELCELFEHLMEDEVDFFDLGDYDDGFDEDDCLSLGQFDSSSDDDYTV